MKYLKECIMQEILFSNNQMGFETRQELIRCKDCRYCEHPQSEKDWCLKGHLHGNAETWFCADGERKEQK